MNSQSSDDKRVIPDKKKHILKGITIVLLIIVLLTAVDGFRNPAEQIVTRHIMVKMVEGYQHYISAVFFSKTRICRYTPT